MLWDFYKSKPNYNSNEAFVKKMEKAMADALEMAEKASEEREA